MNASCRTLSKTGVLLIALIGSLGLGLSAVGCAGPSSPTPSPAPQEEEAVAPVEEEPIAEEPPAPTVSYKDNADLLFEDIPAERVIDARELKDLVDGETKLKIVDIRSWAAFDEESIPGSTSIPAGQQIVLRIDEISKTVSLVLVAQDTERLAETRQTLIDLGIPEENILVLDGGIDAWKAAGYATKTTLDGETYRC